MSRHPIHRPMIVIAQSIAAWILGFVVVYALGIGNGWEIVAIPVMMTVGVWSAGAVVERDRRNSRTVLRMLALSLLGGLVMATGIFRFAGIFLPMAGAFFGYYLHDVRRIATKGA